MPSKPAVTSAKKTGIPGKSQASVKKHERSSSEESNSEDEQPTITTAKCSSFCTGFYVACMCKM